MLQIITRLNPKTNNLEELVVLDTNTKPAELAQLDKNIKIALCAPNSFIPVTVLRALPLHINRIENYHGDTTLLPGAFNRLSIIANMPVVSKSSLKTAFYWYKKNVLGAQDSPPKSHPATSPGFFAKPLTSAKHDPLRKPGTKRKLNIPEDGAEERSPKKSRKH